MLHYTTIYSHLNKIKIPKIISEINGFGLLDSKTYCKIREIRELGIIFILDQILLLVNIQVTMN